MAKKREKKITPARPQLGDNVEILSAGEKEALGTLGQFRQRLPLAGADQNGQSPGLHHCLSIILVQMKLWYLLLGGLQPRSK